MRPLIGRIGPANLGWLVIVVEFTEMPNYHGSEFMVSAARCIDSLGNVSQQRVDGLRILGPAPDGWRPDMLKEGSEWIKQLTG